MTPLILRGFSDLEEAGVEVGGFFFFFEREHAVFVYTCMHVSLYPFGFQDRGTHSALVPCLARCSLPCVWWNSFSSTVVLGGAGRNFRAVLVEGAAGVEQWFQLENIVSRISVVSGNQW